MKQPFAVFEPHWGPHGILPPPPPPRPRQTAHPYQVARTKRAFAAQRQLDIDGVVRTPFTISNACLAPDEDILSKHVLELRRMFPSRPPEPLGPGIAPIFIDEESIEEPHFILNCIKTTHKLRMAERLLNPRRKHVPKKKFGGHQVPRRAASVDAMDLDHDDTAMRRPFLSRVARSLSNLSFLPVVPPTAPRTPTGHRPVPDDDEDDDEELIAAEFERQYLLTLEKAQQMQF